MKIANVQLIKASETDPHLPVGAVDLVLVVDVYHELAYPYEVMQKVHAPFDAIRLQQLVDLRFGRIKELPPRQEPQR